MEVLVAPAEFYFRAGNYHVTYNLAKRINAKFHIIASKIDDTAKKELSKHELYELNTSLLFYPFKILTHGKKLVKNVDLIHHMSPFAIGKDFNLLALSTEKPFVIGPIEIPHKFFDDEFEFLRLPIFAKAFRKSKLRSKFSIETLERCDVAVAVNRQTKKVLSNFVERKKIVVIPFGVDTKKFRYVPPSHHLNILAVGHHIKRKGLEYLIRAMVKIIREFPNTKLHIVGTGPQTKTLEHLVRKLDLSDNVIFHGRVHEKNLLQLYEQCRVFCHPSLSEAFSPVRLEVMASGKPIVATTAASGSEEMIQHGKTGFLVSPADIDALADAIMRLLSDYNLSHKMGKRARKIVERKYDWKIVAEKYYKTYLKLANQ